MEKLDEMSDKFIDAKDFNVGEFMTYQKAWKKEYIELSKVLSECPALFEYVRKYIAVSGNCIAHTHQMTIDNRKTGLEMLADLAGNIEEIREDIGEGPLKRFEGKSPTQWYKDLFQQSLDLIVTEGKKRGMKEYE